MRRLSSIVVSLLASISLIVVGASVALGASVDPSTLQPPPPPPTPDATPRAGRSSATRS